MPPRRSPKGLQRRGHLPQGLPPPRMEDHHHRRVSPSLSGAGDSILLPLPLPPPLPPAMPHLASQLMVRKKKDLLLPSGRPPAAFPPYPDLPWPFFPRRPIGPCTFSSSWYCVRSTFAPLSVRHQAISPWGRKRGGGAPGMKKKR